MSADEHVTISYSKSDSAFHKVVTNLVGADQVAYRNCLRYREQLYSLQEPLYQYVKQAFITFQKYLFQLEVYPSHRGYIRDFDLRKILIVYTRLDYYRSSEFKFDGWIDETDGWIVLAKCFVSDFSTDVQIVDPVVLLKLLTSCFLFHRDIINKAHLVLQGRNSFYGHLPELVLHDGDVSNARSKNVSTVTVSVAFQHLQDILECISKDTNQQSYPHKSVILQGYQTIFVINANGRRVNFTELGT